MKITEALLEKTIEAMRGRMHVDPIWHIRIAARNDPMDAEDARDYADITIDDATHFAYLRINLYNIPDAATLRETVAHELLHLVMYPLAAHAKVLALDAGGEHHAARVIEIEESVVDRLARAFR